MKKLLNAVSIMIVFFLAVFYVPIVHFTKGSRTIKVGKQSLTINYSS